MEADTPSQRGTAVTHGGTTSEGLSLAPPRTPPCAYYGRSGEPDSAAHREAGRPSGSLAPSVGCGLDPYTWQESGLPCKKLPATSSNDLPLVLWHRGRSEAQHTRGVIM